MAEKEARLNIRITATNEASKVFIELAEIAERMAKTFQTASESVNKSFGTIAKAAMTSSEESMKSMNMLRESVSGLGTSMDRMSGNIEKAMTRASKSAQEHGKTIADSVMYMDAQFAGDTIKNAGESVVGFFEKSVSSAVDFDQAIVNTAASINSNLPAGIRLASNEIDAMKQKALDLGQSGFFSANQIGEAMNTLARQGIDYKTIMGGAIETVSAVAAANQEDINQTANVVSDIIHEMGDSLREEFGPDLKAQMTGIGDAMTSALHHARISMDDFLNTMKYFGPQASAMGMGVKDAAAAVALLGQHGIRGSQAGTTLRRMLTNLLPVSKQAAEEMENLGLITADGTNRFFDASGKMKSLVEIQSILHDSLEGLTDAQRQHAIKVIFGQYALSGMTAIADTAPDKFGKLIQSMSKVGVTADLVADKSHGWGIQVQALKAHFETFMKDIGERFKPVVIPIMDALNGLMEHWKALSDPVKNAIIAFTAITGVVLVIGGAILAFVGTMGMLVTSFTAALPLLGTIAVGFGWVIVAVAAVVAVVVGLKTVWNHNFAGIRDITHSVLTSIKEAITAAWNYISPTIIGALERISAFWNDVWPKLKELFSNVWNGMRLFLTPILSGIFINISAVLGFIKGAWNDTWNAIKDLLKLVWDGIVDIIRLAWDIVSGVFKVALDLLTGHWSDAWKHMKELLSNIWNDIKQLFSNFVDNALNFGKNLVMAVAHGIEGAIGAVISAAKRVVDAIKSIFSTAPTAPSINAPSNIPAYAEGGRVDRPTIALIGEGGEPEYVIPESKLKNGGLVGNLSVGYAPLPSTIPFSGSGNLYSVVQHNTFQINGVGKDNHDLANEVAKVLKQQLSFAL